MAGKVKMKVNQDSKATCSVCGATRKTSLDMFDMKILNVGTFTICDLCNEEIFNKALKATCYINGRVKNNHDMQVRNSRLPAFKKAYLEELSTSGTSTSKGLSYDELPEHLKEEARREREEEGL